MVAIKSIIILTLSAFAVASPLLGRGLSGEESGAESRGESRGDRGDRGDREDRGQNQFVDGQNVRCEKDTRLSCCNSKSEGDGLLGAFNVGAQCMDLSVPVGVLGVAGIGGPKDKKCQDGKLQCCSIKDTNSHNNEGFFVIDNSNFGQCMDPEFQDIV